MKLIYEHFSVIKNYFGSTLSIGCAPIWISSPSAPLKLSLEFSIHAHTWEYLLLAHRCGESAPRVFRLLPWCDFAPGAEMNLPAWLQIYQRRALPLAACVCGDENRKVLMAKIATNIFWTLRAEPKAICLQARAASSNKTGRNMQRRWAKTNRLFLIS